MKYVLVIGDGMADNPIPELQEKTPLQHAKTPTFDKLASTGILGSALTIPDGMQAGSDTAMLSIFGYDPRQFFSGRAPLEAAAVGITLSAGDIAYRVNMVSFEDSKDVNIAYKDKKIMSHSAGGIDGKTSDELIKDLCNLPKFKEAIERAGITIYPGSSFRHIGVQSGLKNVDISSSHPLTPPHDHLGETLGQHLPKGSENAAELSELMRLAHDYLNTHPLNDQRRANGELPANGIWFWAEGVALELPNFVEKYNKTGTVISAVPLCQGIGMLIGLERILVKGATGELHTNYEGKVDAAISSLLTHDFTTVHIEAPDECTHNGDLKGKLQAIEWVDSRVVAPIIQRLSESKTDFRLLIMPDHRTLMSTRGHDSGMVPYALYDSRNPQKTAVRSFCEADAADTGIVTVGTSLMDLLFETKI